MAPVYPVPVFNYTAAPAYPTAAPVYNATAAVPATEAAPVPTAAVSPPTQAVSDATAAPVVLPTVSGKFWFSCCMLKYCNNRTFSKTSSSHHIIIAQLNELTASEIWPNHHRGRRHHYHHNYHE